MAKKMEPLKEHQSNLVKVIKPHREEGWFVFTEYEIDEEILETHGKVIHKTNPDIFAIFKDQLVNRILSIFEL